ncbi:MAG: GAF domain-containing protein, partial [Okeania sp. SIO3B3]|nr:GAF domain-containing protein [Okeania sp. SIO3B3]
MKLKKFLAQKEVSTVIHSLVQTFNTTVRIENHKGTELLTEGSGPLDEAERHLVTVGDTAIGWVIGSPAMKPIADLLSYLARREAERKQLGNEVLDKYREISLLYTLSERLQTSLEVDAVARVTLEEAGRLINVDGGALLMYNAEKNLLETICVHGTRYTLDMVITPGVGITGSVFQMGQAEIVNDVTQDSRYKPLGSPISSLICATLKSDKNTLGAMVMSSANPVEFTASDLQLFKTVASQAAPAIERAILYETLEEKVRQRTAELRYRAVQLEASIGVGQRITSILTVDTLLNEVADLIQFGFNYTYVGIFLVSETTNQLIASTQVGESGREVVAAELETHDDYQAIIDWVAENRRALRVDDLANDERYAHIRLKSDNHSELALPLIMGERLLGVLDIQSAA